MNIEFNVKILNLNLPVKTRVFLTNPAIGELARYAGLGSCNFYVGPTLANAIITDILIDAPGYAPYSYFAETGQWITFKDTTINVEIVLTPSFKKPSRDQIVNVKANFCNLFDSEGIPIFDGFIDYLIINNLPKANDWIRILREAGSTHITLDLSGDYNENLGWINRYPIPGIDWTNNLSGFSQIINWVQQGGFIPIIKLALDGQNYSPDGLTYGWQWGIDNIERILKQLDKYTNSVLWSTGWDGCFPNWSRNQTIVMLQHLRNILGPTACIDTEFAGPGTVGYSHMGSGSGDWTPDTLGILDNFSIEVMTYPPNSVGVQQTASRLLGPKAKNIDTPNIGPYYLRNLEKKINICLFEDIAYQAIRKQVNSRNAIESARFCANYGFTSFGNGQP